jgi:hypothetical protein
VKDRRPERPSRSVQVSMSFSFGDPFNAATHPYRESSCIHPASSADYRGRSGCRPDKAYQPRRSDRHRHWCSRLPTAWFHGPRRPNPFRHTPCIPSPLLQFLAVLGALAVPACPVKPMISLVTMQKWEYRSFPVVVNEGLGKHLNAIDDAGWEVIQLIQAKPAPDCEPVYSVLCRRPLSL